MMPTRSGNPTAAEKRAALAAKQAAEEAAKGWVFRVITRTGIEDPTFLPMKTLQESESRRDEIIAREERKWDASDEQDRARPLSVGIEHWNGSRFVSVPGSERKGLYVVR